MLNTNDNNSSHFAGLINSFILHQLYIVFNNIASNNFKYFLINNLKHKIK